MTYDEIKAAALALPNVERGELLRILDDSIFDDADLTSEQSADLKNRIAEHEANPSDVIDGEKAFAELFERSRRRNASERSA